MKAFILAGGLGTRLQSIWQGSPKPMAMVHSKPFLAYLIERLAAQGWRNLVLCVGYQAQMIMDYLGNGDVFNVQIEYAVEESLLGTGGALKNAQQFLGSEPFLVLNGDTYLEIDINLLVANYIHRRSGDEKCIGALAAVPVTDSSAYGTLSINPEGMVLAFDEKSSQCGRWINGGVYCLSAEVLNWIPPGHKASLERETFPSLLQDGYRLHAHTASGFFVDIGTPEGYQRFVEYIGG